MMDGKIVVVGSSNMDLITYTSILPKVGETVKGNDFKMGFGGKGANQAVQAAKLGGKVSMITKVGQDTFGRDTIKNYNDLGINTNGVLVTNSAPTGVAPITVNTLTGNNSIIIVPGANDQLLPEDIYKLELDIKSARVLLCQLEIPLQTTIAALKIAKQAGVITIFNPAPATDILPSEIYAYCDYVCPNETELEILTKQSVETLDNIKVAANILLKRGAKKVLVTLGSRGSMLIEENNILHLPATPVEKVVDTTGAGDSFLGALGYALANNYQIEKAIKLATNIAGWSVQYTGTQTSFPAHTDIKHLHLHED